jgi:c-di-GMP-binding flagellar brake protein YcgR
MERRTERRVRRPEGTSSERRGSTRFSLNLELHYTVSGRPGPMETGSGRTIDLSSSGLRFVAQRPLEQGLRLDVAIEWPVLLDGGVHLQLIAAGLVVWTKGAETALRIQRHELRTRRVGLSVAPLRDRSAP